jgi:malate/lactate dehydrogenase
MITDTNRLDQNRALCQISNKLNVPVRDVKNIVIWGNHSSTQYPDIKNAQAVINGKVTQVPSVVTDQKYIEESFIPTVQNRGADIIKARG